MKQTVLVSACLLGLKTRYDGTDAFCVEAREALAGKTPVPICPEQLGGLHTPRPCVMIEKGTGADIIDGKARIIDENGRDVTEVFLKGAQQTLEAARLTGAKEAYLKEKSPSCGASLIYNKGNNLVNGMGVTAELLKRSGIKITGFNGGRK